MQQGFFLSSWDHSSSSQRRVPLPWSFKCFPGHHCSHCCRHAELSRSWDKREWEKNRPKKMKLSPFTLICRGPLSRNRGLFKECFSLYPVCSFGFQITFDSRLRDMRGITKAKFVASLGGFCILTSFPKLPATIYFFRPQIIVPCFLSRVFQLHSVRKVGWNIFTPS